MESILAVLHSTQALQSIARRQSLHQACMNLLYLQHFVCDKTSMVHMATAKNYQGREILLEAGLTLFVPELSLYQCQQQVNIKGVTA